MSQRFGCKAKSLNLPETWKEKHYIFSGVSTSQDDSFLKHSEYQHPYIFSHQLTLNQCLQTRIFCYIFLYRNKIFYFYLFNKILCFVYINNQMPQNVLVFFQAHCTSEWTVLIYWKLQWDVILQIIFSGLTTSSKTNTQSEAQGRMSFGQSPWLAESFMHHKSLVGRFHLLHRDILLKCISPVLQQSIKWKQ